MGKTVPHSVTFRASPERLFELYLLEALEGVSGSLRGRTVP
mgnify:CR=1 FL=1